MATKKVPVVYYHEGKRLVIGTAVMEIGKEKVISEAEIDITHAELTVIKTSFVGSIAKER